MSKEKFLSKFSVLLDEMHDMLANGMEEYGMSNEDMNDITKSALHVIATANDLAYDNEVIGNLEIVKQVIFQENILVKL